MTSPLASAEKLNYQSGFGNEFATEAVEGALPVGRNSPQKAPLSSLIIRARRLSPALGGYW